MNAEKTGNIFPDMTLIELKHKEITDKILHAFLKVVYPQMGSGFLEKVYENAMALALRDIGLKVRQQAGIHVYFRGEVIGEYFADLLVEDAVIVELKAATQLNVEHEAQLLNYLRATPYEVGLLLILVQSRNFDARFLTMPARRSPGNE